MYQYSGAADPEIFPRGKGGGEFRTSDYFVRTVVFLAFHRSQMEISEHSTQSSAIDVCVLGGGGCFWGPPGQYELKRFIFAQI